jgi:hypothetical protein
MTKTFISAAVLALCLCFSGTAFAQDEEDGFQFPPQQPAADPAPVNPATKSLDSGRLMIVVGSPRNFGYRIGELIPVTIVISGDNNVRVNLEALQRGFLTNDASDFEPAGKPVVTMEERNGKKIWRVQILVRSWVMKPVLVLNCDFHYAIELLPDGKTPNWKPVTTPDFVIETSNTATDAAKELLPGDMDFKESPKPALVKPLKIAGYVLLSLLPLWLLIKLWQRVRPARPLTTREQAWLEFDAVMDEAKAQGGLKYEHLQRIAGTLRSFLHIDAVPLSQVAIPLEQFFAIYDNRVEMMTISVSALSKLERALYSKMPLTHNEQIALMQEIERIVPRP